MTTEKKKIEVVLANVIVDYPSLFVKANNPKYPKEENERKYTCTFFLNKETHSKEIEEITTLIKTLFKENKIALESANYKVFKDLAPFADADDSLEIVRDFYKLSASRFDKPRVTDRNNQVVINDELVKRGSVVHALVTFQINSYNTLSCKLEHVKHLRDGDPILIANAPRDATDKFAMLKDSIVESDLYDNSIPF